MARRVATRIQRAIPGNVAINGLTVRLSNSDALERYVRVFQRFGDDKSLLYVGMLAKNTFSRYVPYRTGALRKSADVVISTDDVTVTWEGPHSVPYAHYQYMGQIYDYNHVYFKNGLVAGWYSSSSPKTPSGRMMVPNRRYTLFDKNGKYICRLGYTLHGTRHHWIDFVVSNPQIYNPMKYRMTQYLYKKVVSEFGGTPVGAKK